MALGRVFVLGSQGRLFMIDPSQPGGSATEVANGLADTPRSLAFDGSRIWTANSFGSVSIIAPGPTMPWAVTNVTTGLTFAGSVVFDGANIWVTDEGPGAIHKLNDSGGILQTVPIGTLPAAPTFDGMNLWVPDTASASVKVIRSRTGEIISTLTGNGLSGPWAAAFDGERVLVTSLDGNGVSLWRAADLSPLGEISTGANSIPRGGL